MGKRFKYQSNYRYWRKRSRNRFYKIPVQDGVDNPRTGFRELKLERDRLNLSVVGENEQTSE